MEMDFSSDIRPADVGEMQYHATERAKILRHPNQKVLPILKRRPDLPSQLTIRETLDDIVDEREDLLTGPRLAEVFGRVVLVLRKCPEFLGDLLLGLLRNFLQAEDGIRDDLVTGVQTCALPI